MLYFLGHHLVLILESHWGLLLSATVIAGVVVVETFPFVWTPPCVIKVPLCISSPSLSENLSCPLMGVCWWVSLIVGFGLQFHLCLQWHFCPLCGALQHCCMRTCHFLICQSDRSWVANWQCELQAEASSLRHAVLEKLPFLCATGILNPPHSFLLQASSPPASGLIVRVYYLTIYSLTLPSPTEVHRLQGVVNSGETWNKISA